MFADKKMLAVEAPRFGKGSGAKEDSSPASIASVFILDIFDKKCQYVLFICQLLVRHPSCSFFSESALTLFYGPETIWMGQFIFFAKP